MGQTLLGYALWAPNNDSFMNKNMYEINICDCLDYVANRHLHLSANFKLIIKKYDFSFTYDSYLIVSKHFKDFCRENAYKGIEFFPIPNYKDRYYFSALSIKKFDAKRRQVRFLEFNDKC